MERRKWLDEYTVTQMKFGDETVDNKQLAGMTLRPKYSTNKSA